MELQNENERHMTTDVSKIFNNEIIGALQLCVHAEEEKGKNKIFQYSELI